jgi:Kinesin motor domain
MELLQRGLRGRQTQATKANAVSSRSHCIFAADVTLHVLQGGVLQALSPTLTLVDLAGDDATRPKVAHARMHVHQSACKACRPSAHIWHLCSAPARAAAVEAA